MTPSPVATKLQLVVVPHARWDREGHAPFEVSRRRLVRLVDQLLGLFEADPGYTHFMLDGQSVLLEDYLQIRPEREAALHALVESGRLAVGPWYVLPDAFLVSGEGLVRNLQIGLGIAHRFGRAMQLGYLPDSFGQAAQLPQVFAGFGFDAGCLWRGVDDDVPGLEWNWEALDGTAVYLQWLYGGYGNFADMPADPEAADDALKTEIARLAKHGKSHTRLLLNGSDHQMPQACLPSHIRHLNARNAEWEVVQGSLAAVIDRARREAGALASVKGELRGAADAALLPGVLSARSDLKSENARAQVALERWVEPFAAIASLTGRAYPAALVRHAWKLLLQNHAQRAIGGCAIDPVHRQMMARFEQVGQLAELLRHEAFAALQGEDPDAELPRQEGLRLYNPHPWAHVAPVEAELTLDADPDTEPVFSLLDEAEQPVPFEIRSIERGVRVAGDAAHVPTVRVRLRLAAELPALGFRTLKVERQAGAEVNHPELYAGNNWIENRYFKVRAVDGRLEIFDKSLEETVVHDFEDSGDRGDAHNYCPVDGEGSIRTGNWTWDAREITHAGNSLRMTLTANWRLPGHLFEDRSSRIGSAPLPITVEVSLHAGVRRVEFETAVTNVSRDHRFRAAFKTPGAIARTHADTAFGWVTRASQVPEKTWAETPVGTFPMVHQVLVDRPLGQIGVAAVGLHEYEAVDDTIFLTLIRAVGWLSRHDLSTRQGDAGPMVAVPEAQMLGRWHFRYAWTSQNDDEPFGTVQRQAQAFAVPAAAHPLAAWSGFEAGSYLGVDQPAWQFSALKQAETGTGLVLRVFNAGAEPREGTITFGFPVKAASLARLDETPGEPVVLDGDRLSLSLRGFEIATFLLDPA
ncbi:Mannosylglycerate hydrolase [compost metagenome]